MGRGHGLWTCAHRTICWWCRARVSLRSCAQCMLLATMLNRATTQLVCVTSHAACRIDGLTCAVVTVKRRLCRPVTWERWLTVPLTYIRPQNHSCRSRTLSGLSLVCNMSNQTMRLISILVCCPALNTLPDILSLQSHASFGVAYRRSLSLSYLLLQKEKSLERIMNVTQRGRFLHT